MSQLTGEIATVEAVADEIGKCGSSLLRNTERIVNMTLQVSEIAETGLRIQGIVISF